MTNAADPASAPCRRFPTDSDGLVHLSVVDDDPLVAAFIAHVADEVGFRTCCATSANAFRDLYEEAAPNVVVLDLRMPGGDGVELLRFLAEEKSDSLIFIISGVDSRVLESACRLAAARGLRVGGSFSKPVPRATLVQALAAGWRLVRETGSAAAKRVSA